jgi:DNA-binding CsgD family transcriptional regulator/PAS domain-containing protein
MGLAGGHDEILDLVYETSVDPGVWPVLLERFAHAMGGQSAALRSYDLLTEVGTVTASRLDSAALDRQFRAYATRNPLKSTPDILHRRLRESAGYSPGTMMDVEWLSKADFVQTDYYRDVYQPLDIHSDISIGFDSKDMFWSGVDVYRSKSQGAFTGDDLAVCAALHPHMVRAWKLSRKLSGVRQLNDSLADFAERSPHGLFILGSGGRVRHVNATGQAILARSKGLQVTGGQLAGATPDATGRLRRMVAAAAVTGVARAGGSMALPQPDGLRPLSVIVAPLRAEHAQALLDGPAVMVCVTDLDAQVSLPEQRLRELFDLTPAEARVAITLFEGFDPRITAEKLKISVWTVRRHLAQIFDKTRTGSQVELARLMMRTLGAALG